MNLDQRMQQDQLQTFHFHRSTETSHSAIWCCSVECTSQVWGGRGTSANCQPPQAMSAAFQIQTPTLSPSLSACPPLSDALLDCILVDPSCVLTGQAVLMFPIIITISLCSPTHPTGQVRGSCSQVQHSEAYSDRQGQTSMFKVHRAFL